MHENAQLGPPSLFSVSEPNRVHVYKLDTSLNVLCEHIVDGFLENAYYYLNRVKATDDGGFMLMGARRDLSDPSGYFEGRAQNSLPWIVPWTLPNRRRANHLLLCRILAVRASACYWVGRLSMAPYR